MSFKLNKIVLVFIFLTIFLNLVFSETTYYNFQTRPISISERFCPNYYPISNCPIPGQHPEAGRGCACALYDGGVVRVTCCEPISLQVDATTGEPLYRQTTCNYFVNQQTYIANNIPRIGTMNCTPPESGDPDDPIISDPVSGGDCGDRARIYSYLIESWPNESEYCSKGETTSEPDFPEIGQSVSWQCIFEEQSSQNCVARRLSESEDFGEIENNIFNSITYFDGEYKNGELEISTQCLIGIDGEFSIPSLEFSQLVSCDVDKDFFKIEGVELEAGVIELILKIPTPCEVCKKSIYLNIRNESEQTVSIPDFNLILIILIISIITIALKIDKK